MSTSKVLRIVILLVLPLVAVFFSGCSSYGGGSLLNAHSGTAALKASFMDDSPPDKVYSGTEFSVGVILDNYGATKITNGMVVIGADEFNEKMISGADKYTFSIDGRDTTRTFRGERDVTFFKLNAPNIAPKTEQATTISMKTCYSYATTAQANVCIDTVLDTYDSGKRACTMKEKINLGSQGAPITVSEIDIARAFQSRDIVRFVFTIRVSNAGNGFVIRQSDISKFCGSGAFSDTSQSAFGRAIVSATLGVDKLICTGKDYADLSQNDEDYVVCTSKDMPVKDNAYATPLKVNVAYGYVDSYTKEIMIIDLPK